MSVTRTRRKSKIRFNGNAGDEFGNSADAAIERALLLRAVARVLEGVIPKPGGHGKADLLLRFMSKNEESLGIAGLDPGPAEIDLDEFSRLERKRVLRNLLRALPDNPVCKPSALDRRVEFLGDLLALEPFDRLMLGVLARRAMFKVWQSLFEELDVALDLALIIGTTTDAVHRAFTREGGLVAKGLAEPSYRAELELKNFALRFLECSAKTEPEMFRALMPVAPQAKLDTAAYAHMSEQLDQARQLLAHSLDTGERANILFYGMPGTGKTEFARLLAGCLDTPAVSIGEADEDGGEPDREERLAHLAVARKIVARQGSAILVIDEAEDLFLTGLQERASKLWLNKLVEDGSGPHIWIVNNPDLLGEPVVRRMDMAIEFDVPPPSARRRIVERLLDQPALGVLLPDVDGRARLTDALAHLNTSPAIVSAAIRTAGRIGEDAEAAVVIARDLARASGRRASADVLKKQAAFDPSLSAAHIDLAELAVRLTASEMNWSLLLSGPPGTGKSAFARHVAEMAGIDLICVSGSNLMGPFVGETEERIAKAFARAERSRSLLLIDEADSFLGSRDMAVRNWEVSMTNEMLHQMERGRVRFIATTNRVDAFDAASARRFTMHVEFASLTVGQARLLFERSFGMPAPSGLDRISGLVPGDFAQIRERATLLGETSAATLTAWLEVAVLAREGCRARLGF